METPHIPANDSVKALHAAYPAVHAKLESDGYEMASDNTLGRCHGPATLFLEIDHVKGRVLAWVWLVNEEMYLGKQYSVRGPLGPAVEQACHLLEATLAEEQVSGGAVRAEFAEREDVLVD